MRELKGQGKMPGVSLHVSGWESGFIAKALQRVTFGHSEG
jgi:hypothetical protein